MVRVRRAWRKGVREEPAFYVLQLRHRLKSGGYGPGAVRPAVYRSGGNFRGDVLELPREVMGKACGVPMARPLGHSRAPNPPSGSQ